MEELDLKELFNIFWNKKLQIILIIAIFMLVGIIYTLGFTTPKYTSTAKLILAGSSSSSSETSQITQTDINMNSKLISTYSEIVKMNPVIREVKENLGANLDEKVLKNSIKVTSLKDTEVIQITVTYANPSDAAKIANEVANVFMEKIPEIYNINNVQIVEEAEPDNTPSNINHLKDFVIFTFIGIVVSAGYVLVLNMLDTTVKSAEDVEREFKLPVLASVPIYEIETRRTKKGGRR